MLDFLNAFGRILAAALRRLATSPGLSLPEHSLPNSLPNAAILAHLVACDAIMSFMGQKLVE